MPAAIDWTAELEAQIIAGIESGLTLRAVAAKCGISAPMILKKVNASTSFCEQYVRAMDIRTDADCDALVDELNQAPVEAMHGVDSGWVAWQRLRVDTMKWLLSKRNPKKYGDKLQTDGTLEINVKRVITDV